MKAESTITRYSVQSSAAIRWSDFLRIRAMWSVSARVRPMISSMNKAQPGTHTRRRAIRGTSGSVYFEADISSSDTGTYSIRSAHGECSAMRGTFRFCTGRTGSSRKQERSSRLISGQREERYCSWEAWRWILRKPIRRMWMSWCFPTRATMIFRPGPGRCCPGSGQSR